MPSPNEQEFGYRLLAVGTDTEVFLRDKLTKQSIPVIGLLGGTKHEPLPILGGNGFSIQEDNVMAEFNIPPTLDTFIFSSSIDRILCFLEGHFNSKGLELDISPSAIFNYKLLNNVQAQTFGCDPDYCAWTLSENDVDTTNPILRQMRTAGGHIHVSFMKDGKKPELQDVVLLTKMLDLFLGVPSVILDEDIRRRQIYGKAGAFRPKQYTPEISGVEYRTLSNFWIKTQELRQYTFFQIQRVFKFLNSHVNADILLEDIKEPLIEAVNSNNKSLAKNIIDMWNIRLPNTTNTDTITTSAYSFLVETDEESVENSEDGEEDEDNAE